MIRLFLRTIVINLLTIYFTSQILSGMISYVGGYQTLLLASLAIAVVNLFIRPIINLLLLPVHLLTLGLFRWFANLVTLYLVTLMVPRLQIHAFDFEGLNAKFVILPQIHFSAFGAFIVSTLVLTIVFQFIYWLLQD